MTHKQINEKYGKTFGPIELWFIKNLCNWALVQGYAFQRVTLIISLLRASAEIKNREDNKPTIDGFFEDCTKKANSFFPIQYK